MITNSDMISITKCDQQTPLILDSDADRMSSHLQHQSPHITVSAIPSTSSHMNESDDHYSHESTSYEHQHVQSNETAGGAASTVSETDDLENKVFTVNDIQTLLNNQLLSKNCSNEDGKQVEQQHLILVTQNGDKIILIQNSSVETSGGGGSEAAESTVSTSNIQVNSVNESNSNDTSVISKKIKSKVRKSSKIRNNHDNVITNHHPEIRINNRKESTSSYVAEESSSAQLTQQQQQQEEEEENAQSNLIRSHHRNRQQSLMSLLRMLRQQHKDKIVNNEIVAPKWKNPKSGVDDEDAFWDMDEVTNDRNAKSKSPSKISSTHSSIIINSNNNNSSSSSNSGLIKSRLTFDKSTSQQVRWYPELCKQLQNVFGYVRRRSDSVEQLSKYYPSSSQSFQEKCQELRKDMRKIELNIERFQNVLDKELHQMNVKLKRFFELHHLETIAAQIEEEDRLDSERFHRTFTFPHSTLHTNQFNTPTKSTRELLRGYMSQHTNNQSQSKKYISKIELITPASISITAADTSTKRIVKNNLNQIGEVVEGEEEVVVNIDEHDDNDPVPEVRDIDCDAPLELFESFYTMGPTMVSNHRSTTSKTKKFGRKFAKEECQHQDSSSKSKLAKRNHHAF